MSTRCLHFAFPVCLVFAIAGGCRPVAETDQPSGVEDSTVVADGTAESADEAGGIINKKTQEVLKLEEALTDGAVLANTGIDTNNPLLQNAAAYRTSVAKAGSMAVDQAIQLRNAQSIDEPKPLSYEVFVAEIVKPGKPDGIQLAELPYYQEYAWDEENQKLVVVDFPERKEERQKQR